MSVTPDRCRGVALGGLPTVLIVVAVGWLALSPAPAAAFNPLKPICKVVQLRSSATGKACSALAAPGKLLKAGGKLITGHVGGAIHAILGGGSSTAATAVGLAAIGAWVLGGAKFALHETATVLGHTTSPQLRTTWFSSAYWRMAGIAAILTLPFLFAAAVQALMRGDLALLMRAAFGYLPLALIAVGIAAPLTMLLLAASDQLSAIVGSAAGNASSQFLVRAGEVVGVLSFFKGSPFLAFLVGLLAAAGALVLWVELLMREAAVYIVVLMLPLAFAAMVWPARRVWAVRAVEILVALILAKFAIVAVLALGGAALSHGAGGVTGALAGAVLVLLGAFAPWALLRLLPLTELASGAAGSLRSQARPPLGLTADGPPTGLAVGLAESLTAKMAWQAEDVRVGSHGAEAGDAAQAETARLTELEQPLPARQGVEQGGEGFTAASSRNGAGADSARAPDGGDTIGGSVPPNGSNATIAVEHKTTPASDEAPAERSPGMDAMWQAPDLSWPPLTAGLEEWPPLPPGPHDLSESQTERGGTSGGEDHDPLPPRQDPGQGAL